MRMRGILVAGLAVVALLGAAKPAPRPPPELRLEVGMHTAAINRIAVDAAGRYLVTGSDDKTVRVWDAQDGRQLQVLRLPSGAGNDGKVYAVALSPDATLVAAGGWTGSVEEKFSVYLFERASGKMRRLPSLAGRGAIDHLAFSRDGRRLAAVLGRGQGLRVFTVADGALAGKDTACGADSYGADFDSAGRLVTSCYDGSLRLYDAALHRLATVATHMGQRPYAVRFAPEGDRVAVGFDDTTTVEVRSGTDLSLLFMPDTAGIDNGNLGNVAWSQGGARLCAGGRWDVDGKYPIRCWQRGGQGPFSDTPVVESTVMDLVALPQGRVAFAGGDPAWGVLDLNRATQGPLPLRRGPLLDLRDGTLRLDGKGETLAFGNESGGQGSATFSLSRRRLVLGPPEASLAPPRTEAPGLILTPWKNTTAVRLNARRLPLLPYEPSRSLAISADNRSLLLGSEWHVRLLDAEGALLWQKPTPGVAWGVHLAANGRLAVASFGDGTLRWFNVRDGTELLAFFPHADCKRWLLWTPSGYYDASPGAEDLMGWLVDRGRDQSPDFFPASRFQKRLYRPDIISRALDRAAPEPPPNEPLSLPPIVRILSPETDALIGTADATVRVDLRPPTGEPLRKVQLLLGRQPYITLEHDQISPGAYTYQVPLPPGESTLALMAWTANSEASEPAVVTLHRPQTTLKDTPPASVSLPTLNLLAVGATSPKVQPALTYPGVDARAVEKALRRQIGTLYRALAATVLADGDATRDRIIDSLEALARTSTNRDTTLVFLAGHGLMDGRGRYHFVPHDGDPAHVGATLIADFQLIDHLKAIPGRVIVMLDTCHASVALPGTPRGPALNRLILELSRPENGIVVYSAAQGTQRAFEKPEWKHGAFTLALLEALGAERGPALGMATALALQQVREQGKLTLAKLNDYLSERVRELTRGEQQTGYSSPTVSLASDTPLAYLPKE